jgi:hypothetical protein
VFVAAEIVEFNVPPSVNTAAKYDAASASNGTPEGVGVCVKVGVWVCVKVGVFVGVVVFVGVGVGFGGGNTGTLLEMLANELPVNTVL